MIMAADAKKVTEQDKQESNNNGRLYNFFHGPVYWSVVASLSFLCTGLLRAYTSPALLSIQNEVPKNNGSFITASFYYSGSKKDAISWIASVAPLASFLGTILSGPLLQYWGRKRTLLWLSVVSTVGWMLVGKSESFSVLLLGRGLTGLATGLATATAPLYISEVVSRKKISTTSGGTSDKTGLLPGVMLATGILLGFILADQIQVWRKLALVIALFPGGLALLSLTIPESPLWLSSKSIKEEKSKFDLEMETVVPSPTKKKKKPTTSASSEKTGLIPKPNSSSTFSTYFRVGLLMLFQQWSGGNVLIYYLSEILTKNPSSPDDPQSSGLISAQVESTIHSASLIIALFQFIGFFLALPLIDHPRVGRRFLLLLSSSLMTLAHLFLGFHFHHLIINTNNNYNNNESSSNYFNLSSVSNYDFVIRVTSLATLLSCYSIGLGPVPFLFIEKRSSSTTTQEKQINGSNNGLLSKSSYLSSFASLVNHLALFLAVKGFPYLFHLDHQTNRSSSSSHLVSFYHPGPDVTFWLFAGVCWITTLFTFYCIPADNPVSSEK